MKNTARLREFVQAFTHLVEAHGDDEAIVMDKGGELLRALIDNDDWLEDEFAKAHPDHYQQYLLYCDPFERFCVTSFVWGPGQHTPVHNHTVWGLVGVMRGRETCREFANSDGRAELRQLDEHAIEPGEIDRVSPTIGDVHQVANACTDQTSVSIHVYGANIGAVERHVFDARSGLAKPFISGYSNTVVPNIWDRHA
ncbi:MAG: cysteine dioxygenase [Gammaproteobacteria bacterium]